MLCFLRVSGHRTAAQRKGLTENQDLMQAGELLVQRELEEYHHHQHSVSDGGSSSSTTSTGEQQGGGRSGGRGPPPLSPTTHTLILPDDERDGTPHQRETFV